MPVSVVSLVLATCARIAYRGCSYSCKAPATLERPGARHQEVTLMQSKANARRTRVPGHPGVYYRDTPGGRSYEIGYPPEPGASWQWRTIGFDLQDAVAARAEVIVKKHRGENVRRERVSVAEFAPRWLASKTRIAPGTRGLYESNLNKHTLPVLGRKRISDVRVDDVADLIADLLEDLKPNTVRNVIVPLSGMFRHAVRKGLMPTNPISLLETDERPPREQAELRVLSEDEIVALLKACDEVHLPLVLTGLATGL